MPHMPEGIQTQQSEEYLNYPSAAARDMYYYPTRVGRTSYITDKIIKRRKYTSFLLYYIQEGWAVLNDSGREIPLKKDSILLLDCRNSSAYIEKGHFRVLSLRFDGQNTRRLYEEITQHVGNVFTMYDPLPVTTKITRIFEIFKNGQEIHEAQLSRLIYDLLIDLLLFSQTNHFQNAHSSMIETVTDYIHVHYKEDPSVDELAQTVALSPCHFIHLFKQETGLTPHQYIISLKISTVKYLLKNTALSIKEICFESGFSNESVLSATFKRTTGCSPTTYRKAANIRTPEVQLICPPSTPRTAARTLP